jgi:hypothetical protein
MYRSYFVIPILLACGLEAIAAEPAITTGQQIPSEIQMGFNQRFKDYFGANSQALLPFPKLEVQEWKKVLTSRPLKIVFTESDKYYNNKVYSFTLYQTTDDGSYYLDAKGGFWGMDELVYGPVTEKELK